MSANPPAFVRLNESPAAAPPHARSGWFEWARRRFFANGTSALLTLLTLALAVVVAPPLAHFLVLDAVWRAADGAACRVPGAGACWAYIAAKAPFFVYGSYPISERWRVDLTLALAGVLILRLLWPSARPRTMAAIAFFLVFPPVAFILLHGAPALGLPIVGTHLWGGVFVSLLLALVGIVASLPGGVLLALGRQSRLPVVRACCIAFIEFVRGVPLIAVLFMANTMLPLFLPDDWAPDRFLRPMAGVALFAAAYMAETVRAGLRVLPRGQTEGAEALGLNYAQTMRLVVLPQALTIVIPGVVNNFIGLFKDTTLVAIVGIFDFLRTVDTARLDPAWAGPTVAPTGYVFAALFYFAFNFAISRYAAYVERRANRDAR